MSMLTQVFSPLCCLVALLTQGSVFVVAEDVHNPIESFNDEVEVDPIFNIDKITRGSLLETL